jgi:hypothetical protein
MSFVIPAATPYEMGQLIGALLVGLVPLYFLVRAFQGHNGSTKLANLSLALGLAVFVAPERVMGLTPVSDPGLFRLVGVVRILMGITGGVLCVVALVRRHRERTGVLRPVLGGCFSTAHCLMGLAYLFFTFLAQGSLTTEAESWTYDSKDQGISITLPTKNWQVFRGKNRAEFFVDRLNGMQASVLSSRIETLEEFRISKEKLREFTLQNKAEFMDPPEFRVGETETGNPYALVQGMNRSPNGKGPIFVFRCLVWCRDRGLTVDILFEGQTRMVSETGQENEKAIFRLAAKMIGLSVK